MRIFLTRTGENRLRGEVVAALQQAGLAEVDITYSSLTGYCVIVPDAKFLGVVRTVDPGADTTPPGTIATTGP